VSQSPEIRLSPGKGLHLSDLDLWLDCRHPKNVAFVSHAHADHVARHQTILCSPVSAHLLHVRYRIAHARLRVMEFHQSTRLDSFTLTLLPAGHIAGSAMLHVLDETSGASLLYTGDYKLRPSRSAETAVWKNADTLIMESTFGLPRYVLPQTGIIEQQLCSFVRDTIADGRTPVLLGYSLGKAQEIAAILHAHKIPALSAPTVTKMTQALRDVGVPLPEPQPWDSDIPAGHALIAPPQLIRHADFARIPHPRTAMMTGWALHPSSRYRYGCDAVIPLSDHADFPDLLRTADIVKPQKILTVHGSTRELAASLRAKHFNAWSHHGDDQLEFPLDIS
jgi:DNA ligase 1